MKLNISKIKSNKTIQELLEFGIINIDKPSGPTSFSTSEFVCRKLGLKKTSHFANHKACKYGLFVLLLKDG